MTEFGITAPAGSGEGAGAASATSPRRRPAGVGAALWSGLVVGVLLVVMATSYAALVFSGPMDVHLADAVALNLFAAVLALTVVGISSSLPGAIAGPQDVTGAILAVAAAQVAVRIRPGSTTAVLTVVVIMALTSLITGALLFTLGTLGFGDLIRYVPYPVVGGFLAGTGWLLVKGGLAIVTGAPATLSTLTGHGGATTRTKVILLAVFVVVLLVAVRRHRHPLIVPAALAALVAAFYVVVLASGASLGAVERDGWLLGPFEKGDIWRPWLLDALGGADWGAVGAELGTVGSAVVIGVLALLFNASGIETAVDRDLDLNRELRAAGTANVLIGAAGAMPGYQKVSATVLAHVLGPPSRLVAFIAAGVCGITLVFGGSVLSLFPRLALGGLVAFLGLSLLVEWVYDSWFRLRRAECVTVLVILIVIAAGGFLHGVAVGMGVAIALFVLDSSRAEVVTGESSGTSLPSNVERSAPERAVLEARADSIHVVKLQGYLFFGTANRLVQRIRERADASDQPPLKFLVLDLRRVTGVDSSAVFSFVKMTRLGRFREFSIVLTGVPPAIEAQLRRAGVGSDGELRVLPDADRGVQWCEDRILEEHELDLSPPDPVPLGRFIDLTGEDEDRSLATYLEELRVPEGRVLFREGDCSTDLFFVQSGRLTVFLDEPGGGTVRLRTMGPGTVVGEMALYGGERRTASVVTDTPSTILRLSTEALERMQQRDPHIAAEIHRTVARLLAKRLAMTLRSQRDLMI